MANPFEAGIRPHRAAFIRETTFGATPTDPDWLLFSDCFQGYGMTPNTNIGEQRCVGSADVSEFVKGTESHELLVKYYLQRWISAAGDAAYDGLIRNADNELNASHSVLIREAHASGGVLSAGRRIYRYATGCFVNRALLRGEPESGLPVQSELGYMAELARSYQIDQPAVSGTVTIASTSANDTTQSVTVEDDGAGTSETIGPLTGTTPVVGSSSFATVDAVRLSAQCEGDVTITMGGEIIMTIRGSDSYGTVEGDLGLPLLGSGSHGSAIGTAYEKFLGDTVERPSATDLAENIEAFEIEVQNNVESTPRNNTFKRRLVAGARTARARATVFGQSESHRILDDYLRVNPQDLIWTLTGGTLTLQGAILSEPGGPNIEVGQTIMRMGSVFTGKSLVAAAA